MIAQVRGPRVRPAGRGGRRNRYIRAWIHGIEALRRRAGVVLAAGATTTIALGLLGFPLEASVRGAHIGPFEALYSTLGLFAFAGNRFGFPQTTLLRFAYFAAPFVSASALVETALRAVADGSSLLLFGLRG